MQRLFLVIVLHALRGFYLPCCFFSLMSICILRRDANEKQLHFKFFTLKKMSLEFLCIPHYLMLKSNKLNYFWVLHDDDETDYGDNYPFAVAQYRCSHAGTLVAMLCLRWLVEVKASELIQPVFQAAFS